MSKPSKPNTNQGNFLFADLLDQLNPKHPLLQLSKQIDWSVFDEEFSPLYSHLGKPSKHIRLMVGLSILKHMEDLSDEVLVQRWVQNPYYQAFTGEVEFQWKLPCDPTSLTKFRKRIGSTGHVKILAVSIAMHQEKIADRGYRGKSKVNDTQIMTPKPVRKDASVDVMELARKRFRRRAGIEPVIGHLKSDHRLKRNFLKGFAGDQINLVMAAAAFNFKKWMRKVIFWLHKLKPTKIGMKIIFLRHEMTYV